MHLICARKFDSVFPNALLELDREIARDLFDAINRYRERHMMFVDTVNRKHWRESEKAMVIASRAQEWKLFFTLQRAIADAYNLEG